MPPPTNAQLGAAIRKLRRNRTNLSIEGLAEEAGIHRTGLSMIERGLGNPTWEMLRSLASVMGVEIEEIVKVAKEIPAEDSRSPATP